MKKVLVLFATCATLVACQQKGKTEEAKTADTTATTVDSIRYAGEIPAADGPGTRYEIAMATDSTNGFSATETLLEAEKGKDVVNKYTGTAEKIEKDVDGKKKVGYKFTFGEGNDTYFLQVDDATLRMVNDQLEESEAKEMNYDLKVVK